MSSNMPADTAHVVHVTPRMFVRLPAVLATTGLGRSTIYRLVAEGSFPSPVKLGRRAVAWRWTDIEQWGRSRGERIDERRSRSDLGLVAHVASGQGRAQPGASAPLTRRGAR
jgi:prophage regulatory protein